MIKELLQFWAGMIFSEEEEKERKNDPAAAKERDWARRVYVIVGSIVVLILAGVVSYRLLTASFASFDFSQLISLIIALFSIALSAQFYFKATDTSNKFYDRTYRLTKDLFEILGRIEERFGEMLKHIHEDTSATRYEFTQSKNEKRIMLEPTDVLGVAPDAKSSKPHEEKK